MSLGPRRTQQQHEVCRSWATSRDLKITCTCSNWNHGTNVGPFLTCLTHLLRDSHKTQRAEADDFFARLPVPKCHLAACERKGFRSSHSARARCSEQRASSCLPRHRWCRRAWPKNRRQPCLEKGKATLTCQQCPAATSLRHPCLDADCSC